jgi:hypothetical protein
LIAAAVFGAAAMAIVALHLATNATLGFHTDELYYIACGLHPALGYVDFPPVVPLLARLETAVLGVSPWSLRVLPSVMGGLLVVMCGLYVRRLGGSLGLQALALLIGVTAPYLVGTNWVFQTVTFDQVMWVLALYFFLAVVLEGRPRDWILLGLALGVGLEVKYTIAALIVGMLVAIVLNERLRGQLRASPPWIAAGIALVIWAPNLGWQVANGFPSWIYVTNHQSGGSGGVVVYLVYWGLVLALLIPLWLGGFVSVFRDPRLRPIGIACAFPILLFLPVGKSYYAMGTIPIVMAQGLVAVSRIRRPRLRRWLQGGIAVAAILDFLILLQLLVPITSPSQLHAAGLDTKNEVFADSVGWEGVAQQVRSFYDGLPPSVRDSTVIVSAYYGVPEAMQIYSPDGLPAVVSPQLSEYFWLPSNLNATNALMVDYSPDEVTWLCSSTQLLGHLTVPYQVSGLEQGAPVVLCALKVPLGAAWPRLRNFS